MLKAAFGKRLTKELGLIPSNPFVNVTPPKCDDPEVRIVSPDERKALVEWLSKRWNNWKLPLTYLEVLAATGWRATETAALREKDLLGDGHVRVIAENCKTRRHKYGWLPPALYANLQECAAAGWAFGRFSDQLRRLLLLWKRRPSHAARVKDFQPKRLAQWFQDELVHFREGQEGDDHFTLHDFRRTTITDLQMAGVSEKETSLMVGATPEVIRKHYEKLEAMTIAKRAAQKRLPANHQSPAFVAPAARAAAKGLDGEKCVAQTSVG
jgi:integrase